MKVIYAQFFIMLLSINTLFGNTTRWRRNSWPAALVDCPRLDGYPPEWQATMRKFPAEWSGNPRHVLDYPPKWPELPLHVIIFVMSQQGTKKNIEYKKSYKNH